MNKSHLSLAQIQTLHKKGLLNEAKKAYRLFLEDHPRDTQALHGLALIYAEEGDLDSAESILSKAIAIQSDPVMSLHLANVLKAKGLFSQAAQLLLDLIKTNSPFAPAYNNLGTVYFAQEKWQEAMNAFYTAISIQSDYVDAYYNLGLALNKQGLKTEAINAYLAVLELTSDHPGARFQLGCLYLQQKQFKQAYDQFKGIEKEHPHHFETQSNLALSCLRLGKLNEAKTHYLRALEIHADVEILFNLGVISMQQGRIQEAISFYQQALKEEGTYFAAHNNLAVAYLFLKNTELALLHFREALKLQPDNQGIRHTILFLSQDKNVSASPADYISSLFDSYADHYDSHLLQSLQYQVPQAMYHVLKTHIQVQEQAWDILDLGCGTGLCGEYVKPLAKNLVGVDISEKMLAVAKQKNIYDSLVKSDIISYLKNNESSYDLILAADVLVYFGDLNDAFSSIAQALRTGRWFIFNSEISETQAYHLTASGRFAHHQTYLEGLIKKYHFKLVYYESVILREQNNQPVNGHLYLLQKQN